MQLMHFNPEPYTMKVAQHAMYGVHPLPWDMEAGEEDLEPEEGGPYDPQLLVDVARQAGALDLVAAFARCTWAWT